MKWPLALAINARFLARPATGVDRVAIELVTALARRPDVGEIALLHPQGDKLHQDWIEALPDDMRGKLSLRPVGNRRGHAWEQIDLPLALRDATLRGRPLLSLCSTGPILARNQAVMIHDAQVWDAPHSYSRSFRMGYRILLPVLGRSTRHVLTVSHFAAGRLAAVGITRPGRARVVLNGAEHILRTPPDPLVLSRHGITSGGYLLAIGNLAPHKNLRLLVEATAARGAGSPPLIVAGGMNAKVFADAALPQGDGVHYIGRVTDGELRALYEGALALAFPSLTEGFGLPPLEAMLCGCPVVATTGGAVPEVCGDAALYVDPADRAGWTAALTRIASDAELRASLERRGKIHAAGYTWDRAAETLASLVC